MKTASEKKITRKQLIKYLKKANRELAQPGPRGGAHKTSKKDKQDRQSNTVRHIEDE